VGCAPSLRAYAGAPWTGEDGGSVGDEVYDEGKVKRHLGDRWQLFTYSYLKGWR